METIEGQDYIFDRYAFLGVQPEADFPEIKRAIARKRAKCHPDLLAPLAGNKFLAEQLAAMSADFEKTRLLIDQSEEVLSSEVARKIFDEKLATFKADEPKLVSLDGRPIISIMREKISVSQLLNGESCLLAEVEAQVLELHGKYSEENLQNLERRYKEAPEDLLIKKMLKDELSRKLSWAIGKEVLAWEAAGIANKKPREDEIKSFYASDISEAAANEIERYKNDIIPQYIQDSEALLALGSSVQPLLLSWKDAIEETDGDVSPEAFPVVAMAKRTVDEFNLRAAGIEHAAKEKENILDRLAELVDYELFPAQEPTNEIHIFIVKPDGRVQGIFQFMQPSTVQISPLNQVFGRQNWDEIESLMPEMNINVVKILQFSAMEDHPLIELSKVAEMLFQDESVNPFSSFTPD